MKPELTNRNRFASAITIPMALLASVAALATFAQASALADVPIDVVAINPMQVFIPPGFNDNNNVEVVLDGFFSNTCFKLATPDAQVDEQNHRIVIQPKAYAYNHCTPRLMYIPYDQTLSLGIMGSGAYEILVSDPNGALKSRGTLNVAHSEKRGGDDYLYAPVSNAYFESQDRTKPAVIVLQGAFDSPCTVMKEVKTRHIVPNVVEVLPFAEITKEGCQPSPVPFTVRVPLDVTSDERILVHIRSLNGQAINRVTGF